MKYIISTLLIILTLSSCGGDGNKMSVEDLIASDNLEAIQERRTELKTEEATLQDQLRRLDEAIKNLDKSDNSALVTTYNLKDTVFNHFIEVQGDVETKQNVVVRPEYQGTLSKIYVKEGDRVSKGQVLAKIDDGGLGSQVQQMETQAALAKTTFERQKRLWDQNIGSEIQYLQAKASYESAESAVNQMKSQLGKTTVRAPFSGVVDDVITEQGNVVSMGQDLFRIVNLKNMYIEADIPERYIGSVTEGKDVVIEFPVLGETLNTTIRQTGNYINPNNRSFSIEVGVPNSKGNIKPNLTAKLKINDYTNPETILIPLNVISENAEGEQYVYKAIPRENGNSDEAMAQRQYIKTGLSQNGLIEVTEGLSSGESIIVEGARTVKDGQEIKIIKY